MGCLDSGWIFVERSGPSDPPRVGRLAHSDEVSVGVLRGSHPARIDDKGRLKVPNSFRSMVEAQWGSELIVTSVTGESVRVYPMAVWLEIERKLAEVPTSLPSRQRFLDRVSFYGQAVTMDRQGRVLVPQLLRESAAMVGVVYLPLPARTRAPSRVSMWGQDSVGKSSVATGTPTWLSMVESIPVTVV